MGASTSSRRSWRKIDLDPLILDTNILIEALSGAESESARFMRAAEDLGCRFVFPVPVMVELFYQTCELTGDETKALLAVEDVRALTNSEVVGISSGLEGEVARFFMLGNFERIGGALLRKPRRGMVEGPLSMADCMVLALGSALAGLVITKDRAMKRADPGLVMTPSEMLSAMG